MGLCSCTYQWDELGQLGKSGGPHLDEAEKRTYRAAMSNVQLHALVFLLDDVLFCLAFVGDTWHVSVHRVVHQEDGNQEAREDVEQDIENAQNVLLVASISNGVQILDDVLACGGTSKQ